MKAQRCPRNGDPGKRAHPPLSFFRWEGERLWLSARQSARRPAQVHTASAVGAHPEHVLALAVGAVFVLAFPERLFAGMQTALRHP